MMRSFSVLVLLMTSRAFAADCPVQFGVDQYGEQVQSAIAATHDCAEAKAMAESCAMGSSMDGMIVAPALKMCSKRIAVANPQTQKLYKASADLCTRKYARSEGTLAISMRAFCALNVAALFDELLDTPEF